MMVESLNERFAVPGVASFEAGRGGLTRLAITCPACVAELYLLGAQVTHWCPAGGQPVLWVSRHSRFVQGSAIRGGVPICSPWFGAYGRDEGAPLHGFVRLMEWEVESVAATDDGGVAAALKVRFAQTASPVWPELFELRYRVEAGTSLTMNLETRNLGARDLEITEALHTYFRVSDVRNVAVHGLEGVEYWDKVTGGPNSRQGDEPIRFARETDRCYLDTTADCVLDDPGMGRRIRIAKSGSASTVVWNPWIEKAAAMPDYGDDEWPGMLCIETANALDNAVTIPPGQAHAIEARISVS